MDMKEAKKLMQLQQEAMKVKKELENTLIEAEVDWLVITVNWEMKIEKVEFEDTKIVWNKEALEKAILEAANKWYKKAQEVASEKMQWVMGQMWLNMPAWGLPGM